MQQRTGSTSAAWGLGLAACMCNLMIVLVPFGIILGAIALFLVLLPSNRSAAKPALALAGVSFLIAAVWTATVASVFLIDPTLTG